MDIAAWRALGERRILNILRTRRLASKPQLEAKIAEAGPPAIRVDPHHLTAAIRHLISTDRLLQPLSVPQQRSQRNRTRLYAPVDFNLDHPPDAERFARIERAQLAYRDATQEDRGKAFESIVHNSIVRSDAFSWFNAPGHRPPSGLTISDIPVTGSGNLDHWLVHHGSGIPVAVEDKNLRDWLYPDRSEIRDLLGKAATYHMLPVLVARRIHFTTRLFFSRIGALAYQTYFGYYPAEYADRLSDVRHKDGLGFADLRFTDEPPPHLVSFFSNLLPSRIEATMDLFERRIDLVHAYVNRDIEYAAILIELGITQPEDADDVPEAYF